MLTKQKGLAVAASIALIVATSSSSHAIGELSGLNQTSDPITKEHSRSTTLLRQLEIQGFTLMPISEVDKEKSKCKNRGGHPRSVIVSGATKAAVMCVPAQ